MPAIPKRVLNGALRLSRPARVALVQVLFESIDTAPVPAVEKAWHREIRRRLRGLESGKVKAIPWSVARREMFDCVRARDKA